MVSRARSVTLPSPVPYADVAQQLMVAGVEESRRIRRQCREGERKICFKANIEVHDLVSPASTITAPSTATRSRTLACGRMTRPKTWQKNAQGMLPKAHVWGAQLSGS
ncbi:hypothetical protein CSAL01_09295 [Colletotrichum salicis]|uniref:Uncharacterized protein n=1 Tax=Colletotrichum salicis TaxID=1209931 RepID=A0A135SCZ3_9PEZI|nr:hypothetical protein CSAL01_09295 [Colletotrichum salicis]